MMQAEQTIQVSAGEVEAWTTGDADFGNSKLLTALNDAQEKVSRGGDETARVVVIITK